MSKSVEKDARPAVGTMRFLKTCQVCGKVARPAFEWTVEEETFERIEQVMTMLWTCPQCVLARLEDDR